MSTRSKKRYHHIKFDDDDDFETPVFEYLNDKKESDGKRGESDDEVSLQDSEKDSSENEQISDDDGAPEDISFTSGRMAALQQMRDAIKNINAEKLKVKEKRKKIDEQFKEQKRRKLEEIKNARLPDDVLDGLPERLSSKKKVAKEDKRRNEDECSNSLLDEDEGSFADTEDDFGPDGDEDFIPFETERTGGINVQPLKEYQKKSLSQSLTAAEFKHRCLYGSKIHRETSKSKMAKAAKKKSYR